MRELEKAQSSGNKELKVLKDKLAEISILLEELGVAYTKSSGELEHLTTEANTMERKLNAGKLLCFSLSLSFQ